MSQPEQFDVLILGSGTAGKLMAWHMAESGRRTAVVERRWVGRLSQHRLYAQQE
jgi:pyruvate/2-oxoglutarate dehydrogenase complex dihydrolipoamide dehydrogenase (E3) component